MEEVSIEQGKVAYRSGNYEQASIIFGQLVNKGDPEAMFYLGNMIHDGKSLPISTLSAKELLEKSAHAGYLPALYKLRHFGDSNVNILEKKEENVDFEEVSEINESHLSSLQQKAIQGDLFAMYDLAHYNLDEGNNRDGVFWLERAAQKGNSVAQYELGNLFLEGDIVKKDLLQGVLWISRAAEYGVINAISKLADIYCDKKLGFYNPSLGIQKLEKIKTLYPCAYHILGKIILSGEIVDRDVNKAKEYFQEAINNGVVEANKELAKLYLDEDKKQEAIELLSIAAKQNEKDAIYMLAGLYDNGKGVAKLEDKAAFLYNKAAELGHSDAQYKFACICRRNESSNENTLSRRWFKIAAESGNYYAMYEFGLIIKNEADNDIEKERGLLQGKSRYSWYRSNPESPYYKKYRLAFDYIKKSAEHGFKNAEMFLSMMYRDGIGVVSDINSSLKWLKLAAIHGCIEAQVEMAKLYEKGSNIDADLSQAIKWYDSAVKNGNAEAMYNLALMYKNGRGVLNDNEKAFNLFLQAKEKNYSKAKYQLGLCYLKGIGCPKHINLAEKFLAEAAKENDKDAVIELAEFYLNSENTTHNYDSAISLLQKEVENKNSRAMFLLSKLYFSGIGIEKNYAKAITLLENSSDLGNFESMYELGKLYFDGVYVAKNYNRAYDYFRMSAQKGYPPAIHMQGVCHRDGYAASVDLEHALDYFKTAAGKGHVLSYEAIGKIYEQYDSVHHYEKAIRYYRKLVSSNHWNACLLIANVYLKKLNNISEAVRWLELGVEKNEADCAYVYANLHIEGRIENSSITKVIELMQIAAEQGNADAQYFLATEYIKGKNVKQNPQLALNYLDNAIKQNHIKSATMLGKLLVEGEYCEKNLIHAADLFTTAARNGDSVAQYELAKMFKNGTGGLSPSLVDAYMWSVLAIINSNFFPDAQCLRDEVALQLTVAQIQHAQYLVVDYLDRMK